MSINKDQTMVVMVLVGFYKTLSKNFKILNYSSTGDYGSGGFGWIL